jgi:hypothetical protein
MTGLVAYDPTIPWVCADSAPDSIQRRASLRGVIAAPSRLYTLISTTSGPTDGVHLTPDCKRTDHYGRKIQ